MTHNDVRSKEPITLMLLGGGMRFPAFIGALRAIEEKGLNITKIVGASSGSVVGTLYAAGMTPQEMHQEAMGLDPAGFKDFSLKSLLTGKGLYAGKALESWVEEKAKGLRFGDAFRIPPWVVATDILNFRPVLFSAESYPDVKVSTAVRCSMGIPGIFAYRQFNHNGTRRVLVDGSFMAGAVEKMCESQEKVLILKVVSKRTLTSSFAGPLTLKKYFLETLNFCMHALEKEFIAGGKWKTTILLYCGDIPPAKFVLTPSEKKYLFEQGYEQTMKYLEYKWGV
jgi:NTE family protein